MAGVLKKKEKGNGAASATSNTRMSEKEWLFYKYNSNIPLNQPNSFRPIILKGVIFEELDPYNKIGRVIFSMESIEA